MGPNESRLTLTPEQEEHVKTLLPEQMKEYFRELGCEQGAIYRDPYDHNMIHEVENFVPAPTSFTKRVLVDGKTLEFSGASELELEKNIGDYFRGEQAAREEGTTTTRQAAPIATESAEEIANRIELELRFKRGEIDTATYLRESGAVANYLREEGVDLESLRTATSDHFEKSWADATEEFMQTPEGQSWEGGEENKNIIGKIIADADLVGEPSAETLQRAVRFARENHMLVANPELERNRAITEADTPEKIREALGRSRDDYRSVYGR
jgi:hypothetical protein